MNVDFIIIMLIVASVLIVVYRYYDVNARCKEVGQELTWRTYWHKPELYEMITSPDRGTPSERYLVSQFLTSGFKSTAIYHDLIVDSGNGKTSQIDIVVATDAGLIVIEVKDFTGWTFGKGDIKIEDWLRKGYATYINNDKVQNFLSYHSAPIAGASAKSEPLSDAKIQLFTEAAKYPRYISQIPHQWSNCCQIRDSQRVISLKNRYFRSFLACFGRSPL